MGGGGCCSKYSQQEPVRLADMVGHDSRCTPHLKHNRTRHSGTFVVKCSRTDMSRHVQQCWLCGPCAAVLAGASKLASHTSTRDAANAAAAAAAAVPPPTLHTHPTTTTTTQPSTHNQHTHTDTDTERREVTTLTTRLPVSAAAAAARVARVQQCWQTLASLPAAHPPKRSRQCCCCFDMPSPHQVQYQNTSCHTNRNPPSTHTNTYTETGK